MELITTPVTNEGGTILFGDPSVLALEVGPFYRHWTVTSYHVVLGGLRYWLAGRVLGDFEEFTMLNVHVYHLERLITHQVFYVQPELDQLTDVEAYHRCRPDKGDEWFQELPFDRWKMYVNFDGTYRFIWCEVERSTGEPKSPIHGARASADHVERLARELKNLVEGAEGLWPRATLRASR